MEGKVTMRRAEARDLLGIAAINAAVFLGDRDKPESALEWMQCLFRAFPLYQYFVIEVDAEIAGYAGWQMHGGFHRGEPVIELDQLGISPAYQGRGLGPRLTDECIKALLAWIQEKNDRIESHVTFVVWGDALNFNAMNVYAQQFGDGVCGFRTQFGSRGENMLRHHRPITRPVRKE